MCNRHLFDSLISVIGAWLLLIFTLGLFYIIFAIREYKYMNKHCHGKQDLKKLLREIMYEFTFDYWYKR